MKNNSGNFEDFKEISSSKARSANGSPAFTLTELVVLIASLALLAATILPALANTEFRDQFANCTANLRQWGVVCAAYASQDKLNRLPSIYTPFQTFGNLWDVSANMADELQPLGLTVPMWFCPVKPGDFEGIQALNPGISITNVQQFANLNGLGVLQIGGRQYINPFFDIYYSIYIPRKDPAGWWPIDSAYSGPGELPPAGTPQIINTNYVTFGYPLPWPQTAADETTAHNPIMTDRCFTFTPPTTANPYPFDTQAFGENGHPYGNKVANLNLLYADGHVTTHTHNQIRWAWRGFYENGIYNYY